MAIVHQAVSSANGATTDLVVDKPSGTAQNDILVAIWTVEGSESDGSMVLPSGWTQIGFQNGVSSRPSKMAYKVAGDAEPTTYTFSTAPTSRTQGCIISRYDGESTSTPEDVGDNSTTGTATSATCPTITTVTDNAMNVLAVHCHSNLALGTASGYTEAAEIAGNPRTAMDYKLISPAGATGAQTISFTPEISVAWTGWQWAIRPAAAGGDPEGSLVGGKLIRGGLLRHGVLVRSA